MNATPEDILNDNTAHVLPTEHLVVPPEQFDNRAAELYDLLRQANPWLPDPNKVIAHANIELSWGPYDIATLNITVGIDLPTGLIEAMGS